MNEKETRPSDMDQPDPEGEAQLAPGEAEVEQATVALSAELTNLKQLLTAAEGEVAQTKDSLLRLAAEFDNFRKRQKREMDELRQYAAEKVLLEFIPVLDNLERAIRAAPSKDAPADSFISGVIMVADQFRGILENHGVKPFSSLGTPFDPSHHEAVSEREDPNAAPGTVVEEFQRGYTMYERVIRPAMVVVAKPASAPGDGGSNETATDELN